MFKKRARMFALLCVSLLGIGSFGYAGAAPSMPFSQAGTQAVQSLLADYYAGAGEWRECDAPGCRTANSDWGTDAATDALYLRWSDTRDPRLRSIMAELIPTSRRFPAPCTSRPCGYWSDTPAWDAVTLMRVFEVTGDPRALTRARAAYRFVRESAVFFAGACPSIPYQKAAPSQSHVKTLETLANEVKAALLLYRATGASAYLDQARSGYASAREYFLSDSSALYTIHVSDDGAACRTTPQRYFASVNGLMIWNGTELARDLHDPEYLDDALATAHAVDRQLSDPAGIFADTGGENDVVEPLVEAMERLAQDDGSAFAREWIVRNAQAALGARGADGNFARFFDGPSQRTASIWESNGGFAVEIAAAALEPNTDAPTSRSWSGARVDVAPIRSLPVTMSVSGSALALVGEMGADCEAHHIHVFVDGSEINDHAGLWQNPTMPEDHPVFFAWRWSTPGVHTITLRSDGANAGSIALTPYVLR